MLEIRSEPIRRLKLAKLGHLKKAIIDRLETAAREGIQKYPETEKFELPPFEQMIQASSPKQRQKLYAQLYRMPSDYAHVSVLAFKQVIRRREDGGLTVLFNGQLPAHEVTDTVAGLGMMLIMMTSCFATRSTCQNPQS